MKKLVCDRCGFVLIEKKDVNLALEGQRAWEKAVRARGGEPRGVYPCQYIIRCGGEMQLVFENKAAKRFQRLKLFGRQRKSSSRGQD